MSASVPVCVETFFLHYRRAAVEVGAKAAADPRYAERVNASLVENDAAPVRLGADAATWATALYTYERQYQLDLFARQLARLGYSGDVRNEDELARAVVTFCDGRRLPKALRRIICAVNEEARVINGC